MLESVFNKVAGLQACNFIKKRLQHRCFPVKFVKFLRTPFSHNTSRGCLLDLRVLFLGARNINFYRRICVRTKWMTSIESIYNQKTSLLYTIFS